MSDETRDERRHHGHQAIKVQAQCEILEQATVAPGVREEYINLFHGLRKVESLLATTRDPTRCT
jgi:hypothetical protein